MRRLSSGLFAPIGLVVLFSLSAWADDRDSCNKFTGDDSIAACTRLIASKELQGGDLAQAYRSRALNYTLFKGDYDRAIATLPRRFGSIPVTRLPTPSAAPLSFAKATMIARSRI